MALGMDPEVSCGSLEARPVSAGTAWSVCRCVRLPERGLLQEGFFFFSPEYSYSWGLRKTNQTHTAVLPSVTAPGGRRGGEARGRSPDGVRRRRESGVREALWPLWSLPSASEEWLWAAGPSATPRCTPCSGSCRSARPWPRWASSSCRTWGSRRRPARCCSRGRRSRCTGPSASLCGREARGGRAVRASGPQEEPRRPRAGCRHVTCACGGETRARRERARRAGPGWRPRRSRCWRRAGGARGLEPSFGRLEERAAFTLQSGPEPARGALRRAWERVHTARRCRGPAGAPFRKPTFPMARTRSPLPARWRAATPGEVRVRTARGKGAVARPPLRLRTPRARGRVSLWDGQCLLLPPALRRSLSKMCHWSYIKSPGLYKEGVTLIIGEHQGAISLYLGRFQNSLQSLEMIKECNSALWSRLLWGHKNVISVN